MSNEIQTSNTSPDGLLAIAIEKGVDVQQLEKLMDLKERYDADSAKKSFFEAMAKFQSIVPVLTKSKKGHNYKYAPLGDIAAQIRKPLMECGLSYRYEMEHGDLITVICVVTHVDGHSEKTPMCGEPDDSGSKNSIQSRGSTVSYLQRYTLIGALGLTTADEDMDARLPSDPIDDEQIASLEALIDEVSADKKNFLKYLKVNSLPELPARKYGEAVKALEAKRK